MTPEQFKERIATLTKQFDEEYKSALKQLKDKDFKPDNAFISKFMKSKYEYMDFYTNENLEYFLNIVKDFKQKLTPFKKNHWFTIQFDISAYDDGEISDCRLVATWYEPKTTYDAETLAKQQAKTELTTYLKSISGEPNAYSMPDCKLIGLWLEEKIDTKTLCELTYSSCTL